MKAIKEIFESWINDIIASAIGLASIYWALEIKPTNDYWLIPFVFGLICQIPTVYFVIWKHLRNYFGEEK
mgnify:CR=1 FL=1